MLVSETMLQQTTVASGLPYYERWVERFPDVGTLASADIDEALVYWAGLGYYSRCHRLHEIAKLAAFAGWPKGEGWQSLNGIGPYTAAAMASICDGLPFAAVDGNVERVYARVCADPESGSRLKSAAKRWSEANMPKDAPGEWNQAVMELGATICRPRGPKCLECPIQGHCQAFRDSSQGRLPTPKPKPARIDIDMSIHIRVHKMHFGLIKLESNWWKGLWGFPIVEQMDTGPAARLTGSFSHVVTRHRIKFTVWLEALESCSPEFVWVHPIELHKYALPAPFTRAAKLAETKLLETV